ncbi:MAG: hypothetical protein L3J39_11410, partial [Verrucomicrobiales bacterium]|nr:hypothetical protein [Verrucomicrobiales bacterium]
AWCLRFDFFSAANVKSHRIPEWERALIKWLMVKIRVNHDYGAAQGLGAGSCSLLVYGLEYNFGCAC